MQKLGMGRDQQGTTRVGAEGAFTLRRSDYGMTTMIGPVGDEVEISLNFEAILQ